MTAYEIDSGRPLEIKNEGKVALDADFAHVSSPRLARVDVVIVSRKGESRLHDSVYVRESFSWWTRAGGKLLPASGLRPGEILLITSTRKAALRIDWND